VNALIDNYQNIIFNVGIYARLSKEDEQNPDISESIGNQIDYLTHYVIEQGWNLIEVFTDDGYTGTNFNRPDFKRMLKTIEEGRINLVITKDLSRLGRDYIDTGHYIERYFPQHSVRYIAVNDGIDTYERSTNNDMSPFKSVMNDYYSRDISKKVRTSMVVKARKGQFIGAFAPYGYAKSPADKNLLIIDKQVSPVINQIFSSYLAGEGMTRIALLLNEQGTPCPSIYKAQIHQRFKSGKSKVGKWTAETIKAILENPAYAGHLAQHKYAVISYKIKKLKSVPKESWIIAKNCHEAIVREEIFDQVQRLIKLKSNPYSNVAQKSHLLVGLLYCKECGHRMTFTKTAKKWYCICSNYKRFRGCTRHSCCEDTLDSHVLNDLKQAMLDFVDQDKLMKEAHKEIIKKPKVDRIKKELDDAEKRIAEIKKTIKSIYEDKLKGILCEQDFMDLSQNYNKEREVLSNKVVQLNQKRLAEQQDSTDQRLLKLAYDCLGLTDVSRAALLQLINKIEISEDKVIDIHYEFRKS
jgi:site-specific DNA recombinase